MQYQTDIGLEPEEKVDPMNHSMSSAYKSPDKDQHVSISVCVFSFSLSFILSILSILFILSVSSVSFCASLFSESEFRGASQISPPP